MKTINQTQLDQILERHRWWCDNLYGGQRADLSDTDLRFVNLHGADLKYAIMKGANLKCCDLIDANLMGAYLQYADLCGANVSGADLSNADLTFADIRDIKHIKESLFRNVNLSYVKTEKQIISLHITDGYYRRGIITYNATDDEVYSDETAGVPFDKFVEIVKDIDYYKQIIVILKTYKNYDTHRNN